MLSSTTDWIEGPKALVPAILLDPINTRGNELSLELPLGNIDLVLENLPLLALAVRGRGGRPTRGQERQQSDVMRAEMGMVSRRGRERGSNVVVLSVPFHCGERGGRRKLKARERVSGWTMSGGWRIVRSARPLSVPNQPDHKDHLGHVWSVS